MCATPVDCMEIIDIIDIPPPIYRDMMDVIPPYVGE